MRLAVALAATGVFLGLACAENAPPSAVPAPRVSDLQRAIEEFKTQSRALGRRVDSPAAAREKPASGARFHVRLFENFRNDFLDATPHELRQRGSDKNLLRRNQFGFNLAGPLVIPKLYNGGRSTFFSVSYEGVR